VPVGGGPNGVAVGSGDGVGSDAIRPEKQVHAAQVIRQMIMITIANRIALPHLQSPLCLGSTLSGRAGGAGFGFVLDAADCGRDTKASHDLVSARTCIPYLTPECLAKVQLKNLAPCPSLKLVQSPHNKFTVLIWASCL
jgi:hypothetical protein